MSGKIQIMGRIGTEPTLNYTSGGKPVINFMFAQNHYKVDHTTGERSQSGVTWFDATYWCDNDNQAKRLVDAVCKGDLVLLMISKLEPSHWDRPDGSRGETIKAIVSDVFVHSDSISSGQIPEDEEAETEAKSEDAAG